MRIGVVSDSHGNLYMLEKAIKMMEPLDLIIHLGDDYRDIIKLKEKYKLPIEYVSGNNDFGTEKIAEKVINIRGKNIFITHGHRYNVYYGIDSLYFKALEVNAQLVLYGHTHVQDINNSFGVVFLNPGSVSRPRDGKPGCAMILIDDKGDVDFKLFRFEC
ncbi:metallophosphoesterase [Caloramator sp. E03]|uniref:metallophosphoesterase n=1 Tax=Caloramator sp. E03 TaxID=2576307 RepID=UPI00111072CF|nr:metallophosphoesterase [Caloramator sp. E03]QCX33082.1 metallophosphoesterase [Caloramator sp. E03]